MADKSVKGAESLYKKLDIVANAANTIEKAVMRETQRVRNTASLLCPVNHGQLRQSIRTATERTDGGIVGICYTNNKYAAYVEFGTGSVGEQNHEGISPNVSPAYTQEGWWIPGDGIQEADADRYHWTKSEGKDGKAFYFTKGQPAQPFMYPALKMNERVIQMNLAAALDAEIKKAGG